MSMSVCLSARIARNHTARPSNFCTVHMLPVARFFSGGTAIRNVLSSFVDVMFHMMALRQIMYICKRQQNMTSITAEIPAGYHSTIKTTTNHRDLHTGVKSAIYSVLVLNTFYDVSTCITDAECHTGLQNPLS